MDFKAKYIENILNIFVKYYNSANGTNINMFNGINEYEGTNEIMEEFMDCLQEFKESDENIKRLLNISEIHIEEYERLYGLRINENIVCVCEIVFPIINYISKEIDWANVDWKIIPINTQSIDADNEKEVSQKNYNFKIYGTSIDGDSVQHIIQ
jgi:hypothetical protein